MSDLSPLCAQNGLRHDYRFMGSCPGSCAISRNRREVFPVVYFVHAVPARRSAYSIASIMLRSLAIPLPAMSKAVP
jgi:hypothetical protein